MLGFLIAVSLDEQPRNGSAHFERVLPIVDACCGVERPSSFIQLEGSGADTDLGTAVRLREIRQSARDVHMIGPQQRLRAPNLSECEWQGLAQFLAERRKDQFFYAEKLEVTFSCAHGRAVRTAGRLSDGQ